MGFSLRRRFPNAPELPVLLGLLLIALLAWGFLALLGEVKEGDTRSADEAILLSLRHADDLAVPKGPSVLPEMARDVTALGGFTVLPLLVLFVAGYLLLSQKPRIALVVCGATVGGAVILSVIKELVSRPRPEVVPHLMQVHSASFPSGHSMLSATVYLTLAALLAEFSKGRALKVFLITAASLLVLLIGASRVYLGVHYPSDVLAGWSAGLAWATGVWLLTRRLVRQGLVPPTT
jgi:undecaprenyl-diphosphatase